MEKIFYSEEIPCFSITLQYPSILCIVTAEAFTLIQSVYCPLLVFLRWPYFQSYWMYFHFLFELESAFLSQSSHQGRKIYSFEMFGDGTNWCWMIWKGREKKSRIFFWWSGKGDIDIRVGLSVQIFDFVSWDGENSLNFFFLLSSTTLNRMGWQKIWVKRFPYHRIEWFLITFHWNVFRFKLKWKKKKKKIIP